MRKQAKSWFVCALLVALTALFLAGCGSDDIAVHEDSQQKKAAEQTVGESKYKIYLITMDMESAYWQSIDDGCRQAAEEIEGVAYKWIGPDIHDAALQSACVDQAVAEGADAILLAATSTDGVNESLQKADEAGVKIIYVDSPATYDCVVSLATDNEKAGKMAATTMKKALAEANLTTGVIGIMVDNPGTQSTILREQGFRNEFTDTGFTLSETMYMGDYPDNTKKSVTEHPDYVAFFGANEQTTQAVGEQMRDLKRNQIVVGFDTSDAILGLVSDGVIYATMQQNPKDMGYEGLKIAVQTLAGDFTEKNVKKDTGVKVIDKQST